MPLLDDAERGVDPHSGRGTVKNGSRRQVTSELAGLSVPWHSTYRSRRVAPPSTDFVHGYNLPPYQYYRATYPFINLLKNSDNWNGTPGPVNGDEWLTAIPISQTARTSIIALMDPNLGSAPLGSYVWKSASAAANNVTLAVTSSTGITQTSTGVGSCTFDITHPGAGNWNNLTLEVRATAGGGATGVLTDGYVCLASEEALLLSGEIFKPSFLASLTNASALRFMDWLGMNLGPSGDGTDLRYFSQYGSQNESKRTWTMGPDGYPRIPQSACIKLAKKVGAIAVMNVPFGDGALCFTTSVSTSTITTVTRATFDALAFSSNPTAGATSGTLATAWAYPTGSYKLHFNYSGGNEEYYGTLTNGSTSVTWGTALVHNSTSASVPTPRAHGFTNGQRVVHYSFAVSTPSGLAPLVQDTVYFVVNKSTYQFQVALTSGGSPVTLTAGADSVMGDISFSRIATLDIDPYNDLYLPTVQAWYATDSSVKVASEISNETWNGGFQQYRTALSLFGQIADGTPQNHHGHAYAQSLLWDAMEATYPANKIVLAMPTQNGLLAGAGRLTYTISVGPHTGATTGSRMTAKGADGWLMVAPYIDLVNASNTHNPPISTIYSENGNSTAIPDSYWDTCFNRGITALVPNVAFNNTVLGNIPGCSIVCYEWGHQYHFQGSDANAVAIGQNLATYLDGTPGQAMYQRAWSATITAQPMLRVMHYWGAGGYSAKSNIVELWSISGDSNPTPRSQWFQSQ